MYELTAWIPLTKDNLATAAAECPTSQQQRPTLNSYHGTISWRQTGEPASHPVADWLHWTTSILEVAAFCSQWSGYLHWIRICLPRLQCTWAHISQLLPNLLQLLQTLDQRHVKLYGKRCHFFCKSPIASELEMVRNRYRFQTQGLAESLMNGLLTLVWMG